MSKAKKIILAVAVSLSVVILISVGICLVAANYHDIYVFCEKNGIFCKAIGIIDKGSVNDGRFYLWEELEADERVTFDQSMLLVNTEYLLPDDYMPDVFEYKDTTVYMSACMIDDYAALSKAVKDHTGNKLYVSSDFRTEEEQEALYREDPNTATLPGASEHQTGLALDVYVAYYAGDAFIKSPSGRFVNSHAHEYGFIIRYPSYGEDVTGIRYEPWHIRYVGFPHSNVIYNNHITLEEYIDKLAVGSWYSIDGYLVSRQRVSVEGIYLPDDFSSCVISPDNTGCVIITLK